MARPKIKFTAQQIAKMDDLASINCKDYTIASVLGVDVATLTKYYSERLIKKRAEGRLKLRRAQRDKALITKDTAMLIFLGKNELGQADRREVTGRDGDPVVVNLVVKDGVKPKTN